MGHYRSEMGFEDDIRRQEWKERTLAFITKNINADMSKRSIGAVLADIVFDPAKYRLRMQAENNGEML